MRFRDILENTYNNNQRGNFSRTQIAFTNLDLMNGSGKGFWPLYLEKAWAKVHGSYGDTVGGYPDETLAALFGAPVEIISHRYYSNSVQSLSRWKNDRAKKVFVKIWNFREIINSKINQNCSIKAQWSHPLRKAIRILTEVGNINSYDMILETEYASHTKYNLYELYRGSSNYYFSEPDEWQRIPGEGTLSSADPNYFFKRSAKIYKLPGKNIK